MLKKQCNGPWWEHNEIRKHGELQHRLYCSWFDWLLSAMIVKESKNRLEKPKFVFMKNVTLTRDWFKHFPWISWAHYGKIMLRSVLFPNENQKPNPYFQIFSVIKFLRKGWTKQAFRTEHLSTSCFQVGCFYI